MMKPLLIVVIAGGIVGAITGVWMAALLAEAIEVAFGSVQ